jgi:hypothetical protein
MTEPDALRAVDGQGQASEAPVSRRALIIRLLETRDDGLPLPARRDQTPRGFVSGLDDDGKPLRWLTCEDCLSADATMGANGRGRPGCETCGGEGRVPDLGPDPYQKNDPQPYGITGENTDHRVARDVAIARAGNELRRFPGFRLESAKDELAEANKNPDPWERTRQQMYRRYDYGALDAALELLRGHDESAYRLVHSVYVYCWADASTTAEAVIERAMRFIDERMPDPIRAPGFEQGRARRWAERSRAA